MKDYTAYIIVGALIFGIIAASIANDRHIRENGGKVDTIFNTPIKEIFKTK